MKVFVDTEFTSLDSRFQQLISVGMIDETGERELYRLHALEDARALRLAYRATSEDGERPLSLGTL